MGSFARRPRRHRPHNATPPVVSTVVGRLVTSAWTGRAPACAPVCLPLSNRGPLRFYPWRIFRKIKSGPPFGQAPSWRPGCDLQIFFPIFLSRERGMGPGNSKCVLGSRDSKKLRGSRTASDVPQPVEAYPHLGSCLETKCDGDFDSNSGAPTVPDGQIRTKSLLAGIT